MKKPDGTTRPTPEAHSFWSSSSPKPSSNAAVKGIYSPNAGKLEMSDSEI